MRHPVFPEMMLVWTTIGFLFGAFGGLMPEIPFITKRSNHFKGVAAWIVVILLVVAFAFWGLPDVLIVWGTILEGK